MNLLDVNVWLAGLWQRHEAHETVAAWRRSVKAPLALCRVTHMALLRHLTNRSVLGQDVQTRREAWATMTRLQSDAQVVWLNEPERLEQAWRLLSARDDRDVKVWTDDYLAAFAQMAGATLVTLDGPLARRYPDVDVVTL